MSKEHTLRSLAEEFILYKQHLGYTYKTQGYYLMNFVRYAENNQTGETLPSKASITGYLDTLADSQGSLFGTVAVLREFGRHLIKHGYTGIYIIPPKTVTQQAPEPPYFFTGEEIRLFFKACDSIKLNQSFKGRELVIPALFRLLYCCGLRCKEARTLLNKDVHLDANYIDIKQSKGRKSKDIYKQ